MSGQRDLALRDSRRVKQHAEFAHEVLAAHPPPDDDHPPMPDWLAPSGEFTNERPGGPAVPFCAQSHCPWFRHRALVSAELLIWHASRVGPVPAARCALEAKHDPDPLSIEAYRGVLPARLPVCWPALRLTA